MAKWGGHSGCLPVAKAALAAGRTFCPHYLGGAIGLMHSLHLLAAVRGPGLLEVDANANPLREGVLQNLMTVTDGCVSLPGGQGLRSRTGFEAARKPQKSSHRAARVTRGNAMLGLMQDRPLLISQMIDFAAAYYPDVEIVTRTVEGPIHRYGYRDAAKRAKQLAEALQGLGIKLGDRVGTIAWNTYRHFELYFGDLRHRRGAAHAQPAAVRPSMSPTSPTTPKTRSSSSTSTCCRSSRACTTSSRR